MRTTEGGTFDASSPPVFFLAGAPAFIGACPLGEVYPYLLVALNDVQKADARVERWLDEGARLFLDSGIFGLTNEHARKHGVKMDAALRLAPNEIDGFDALLVRYMDTMRKYGPRLWGYCELDQGGPVGKRETRAYLEDEGLAPIPVYHPLVDGWDYLDELLDGYDRICVGNLVWASKATRSELLYTLWERVRRAPHPVWVHILGHTPNPLFISVPFNSADSTEHIYSLQYGSHQNNGRAMCANFSSIRDPAYSGDRRAKGQPEAKLLRGDGKAADFSAYIAHADLRAWHGAVADFDDVLGPLPIYPPLCEGEAAQLKPAPLIAKTRR